MPVPYSDNLYSADSDNEAEQDEALSPADGYFHASSPSHLVSPPRGDEEEQQRDGQYPGVPLVPNVLVEDPTLRQQNASAKAREAEEEQRINSQIGRSIETATASAATGETTPARTRSTPYAHYHRRSVEDESHPPVITGLTRHQQSTPSTSPYAPQSHTSAGESRTLLQHSDAPPAYSPASPSSPQSPSRWGYQTIEGAGGSAQPSNNSNNSAMGVPEERQRLLSQPREPESMVGAPANDSTQQMPLWRRLAQPWRSRYFRRRSEEPWMSRNLRGKATTVLGTLVIISIILIICGVVFGPPHDHGRKNKVPVDTNPDAPEQPGGSHGDLGWSPPRQCYDKPHSFPKLRNRIDFYPGQNLSIIQNIEDHNKGHHMGRQPHVSGEVLVKPTDDSHFQSSGQIELEVISNDGELGVAVTYDKEEQEFVVTVPRAVKWDISNLSPCIQIRITLWVPQDSVLEVLHIGLVHLDINVLPGLKLSPSIATVISTAVGDLTVPGLDKGEASPKDAYELHSRYIDISTVSGDVKGYFPLYDLLRIQSASGDIDVNIGPKSASLKDPKPAALQLATLSGSITAISSITGNKLPPRDYVDTIGTASGDILAELPFTSFGKFESQSGNINVALWPVLDKAVLEGALKPQLITDTKSGDTKVILKGPMWTSIARTAPGISDPTNDPSEPHVPSEQIEIIPIGDDDPYLIIHPAGDDDDDDSEQTNEDTVVAIEPEHLARRSKAPPLIGLYSQHSSISGDITLRYPSSWEGKLKAETISGSQKFRGEGLQVFKYRSGFGTVVDGYKGSGDSRLEVHSISGDEDFLVGEEVDGAD